jgi:hypothetical protein
LSVVKIQRGWIFEVTELMSVDISQGSHLGCPRDGEGYYLHLITGLGALSSARVRYFAVVVIDVLRVVGAPLLAAIVGGLVVHIAARRRDVENERRRQRVDYLVGAYRTLARAANRTLSGERAETFEDALSDVILLGNDEQIQLARETINVLAERREAPMDALLISLRNALRHELDLPGDALRQVPVARITSGTEQHHTPLKLHDVREVSFEQVAAQTGAVLASAASASDRPTPGESRPDITPGFVNLQRDVQGLRELARAAPGAAVVTAYGYVTAR